VWAGTLYNDADVWHFDGKTWSPVDKGFDGTVGAWMDQPAG
jgi:hypothetical protein